MSDDAYFEIRDSLQDDIAKLQKAKAILIAIDTFKDDDLVGIIGKISAAIAIREYEVEKNARIHRTE